MSICLNNTVLHEKIQFLKFSTVLASNMLACLCKVLENNIFGPWKSLKSPWIWKWSCCTHPAYILLFKFVPKLVRQYVISKNMRNARYGADTPHSKPLFFNGEPFTPVCDVDDCCKHVEYVSMWNRILRKKWQMLKYVTRVNAWRFANTSVCDIAICLFLRIRHLFAN